MDFTWTGYCPSAMKVERISSSDNQVGTPPRRYVFSANGALSVQPGATPQGLDRVITQALKARFKAPDASRRISYWACTAMNRPAAAGLAVWRCIKFLGRCPRLE